jgi:hypothetical protein
MKALPPKANNRLLIQTGRFFDCPYGWAITDFVYWKSNTQDDRQWTCHEPKQPFDGLGRIEFLFKTVRLEPDARGWIGEDVAFVLALNPIEKHPDKRQVFPAGVFVRVALGQRRFNFVLS